MKIKSQKLKIKIVLPSLLVTYCLLLVTLPTPAFAFDIGSEFGFGDIKSLGQATSRLVTPVFSIAAGLVVLYFVFGAFDYILARGEKEGIEKAKKKITESIIGFIILMFSFLTLQFLLYSLLRIENLKIIG